MGMRIGYFGGSFDPPHRGHLAVARAARERFGLDEVLFAPTGKQPLKPAGSSASFEDRLAMTTLLCLEAPGMRVSAIDAPRAAGEPNYTAETLSALRESLPQTAALFSILGADAFITLPHWRDVAKLFEAAEWIVVSRPGFAQDQLEAVPLAPAQRARVHLLDGVAEPASATEIRERLQREEPCAEFLPAAVREYIRARGLYGSEEERVASE